MSKTIKVIHNGNNGADGAIRQAQTPSEKINEAKIIKATSEKLDLIIRSLASIIDEAGTVAALINKDVLCENVCHTAFHLKNEEEVREIIGNLKSGCKQAQSLKIALADKHREITGEAKAKKAPTKKRKTILERAFLIVVFSLIALVIYWLVSAGAL